MKNLRYSFLLIILFLLHFSCQRKTETVAPVASSSPKATTQSATLTDPKYGDVYTLDPNRVKLGSQEAGSLARIEDQTLGSQFDGSGQVEIAIWVARSSSAFHNSVACTVDPGYVCIGGGAYADYGTGAGALLTESRPFDGNFNTWVASSKDHYYSNAHTLSVYAIGIKLNGISATTLKSYMSITSNISSVMSHPNISVTVPAGKVLVGGGARDNWTGAGNLLVKSFPTNATTWAVEGKDHWFSDPTSIEAFAVGIPTFIPGFGNLEVSVQSATSAVAGGRANIALTIETGYALACLGADGIYNSQYGGRLLVGMYPVENNTRTVYGAQKDHKDGDGGSITLRVLRIRKI